MPAAAKQFRSARTLSLYKHMKPQSQISRQVGSHRGEEKPIGLRLHQPVTDSAYQTTGSDFRATSDRLKLAPSFRDLSREFLGTEMKRDYVREVFFFVIIVGVSAWPIVSMIQALSVLVK
jgi:hypothetical protein